MSSKRKLTIALAVAAATAVIGFSALASIPTVSPQGIPVTEQLFHTAADPEATSSTEFEPIRSLSHGLCRPRRGLSVTVSMELVGAPVEVRVLTFRRKNKPRRQMLGPRRVAHDPGAGPSAFSFTFGHNFELRPPPRRVQVQWRSPAGEAVRMRRGSVQTLYRSAGDSVC